MSQLLECYLLWGFHGKDPGILSRLARLLIMSCEQDLMHAIPGRTIVLLFKTMARRASSARTLQTYQSGRLILSAANNFLILLCLVIWLGFS